MIRSRLFAIALILSLASIATAQQVIRVPSQVPTIQQALLAAQSGTTILVAPGTYAENLFWPTTDGIRLVSERGAAITTIDGGGRARVVRFPGGLTSSTVLEGFTITNGADKEGAGVYIGSSPTLRDNRIVANTASATTQAAGGGVYVTGGGIPFLERNRIGNNVVKDAARALGGGVFVTGGATPMLVGNEIIGNRSTGIQSAAGGGVNVAGPGASAGLFVSNVIAGNTCAAPGRAEGGGVAASIGPIFLLNNTVANNTLSGASSMKGSGIFFARTASPALQVENCIVAFNTGGAGIHSDGPVATLDYNDVWQNVGGGYAGVRPGPNDVAVDPRFASGAGNYHLTASSPLVDAGNNLPQVDNAGTDFDGDPRFLDGNLDGLAGNAARVDIGADEFSNASLSVAGAPFVGGSLVFTVSGPSSAQYFLFVATAPANLLVQPYGQILLNPGNMALISGGTVPAALRVPIPALPALEGVTVHAQALVASTGGPRVGNLTNRVDITLLRLIRAIAEPFVDTRQADLKNTTASWTLGPNQPGLFANFGYGGNGADGDFIVTGNQVLDSSTRTPGADGVSTWNFRNFRVASGARLTLKGPYPIRVNAQNSCVIEGTIDLSGQNGLNAPPGTATQVGLIAGGVGGPGGGKGGDSNVKPNDPLGALPTELRGGPGRPRAQRCTDLNKTENRLLTVVEPNCGGGTGGNRGLPVGTFLRDGCSGNGGGHAQPGVQTDFLCNNIQAKGREFTIQWVIPSGFGEVSAPTGATGGGAGGNAAITTIGPIPSQDIVAGSAGGGGGGFEIVGLETVTVKSSGVILATGGNGGRGHSTLVGSTTVSGGFGAGGGGGCIWLGGTSVVVETQATLDAQGGLGNPSPPNPARDGSGGDGYIILHDVGGTPNVQAGARVTPPEQPRRLFDPPGHGMSQAVSLFYDSGTSGPLWAFDASDPNTGLVRPGGNLVFATPPVTGQKVFIEFQGAPDVGGKPDPNPANWFPMGSTFTPDISKLRGKGLRHVRFRIRFELGKRQKTQPANRVTVRLLLIQY